MSGAYRIEISTNNRAGCKNTECNKKGDKILKGQLRFGIYVTSANWQSWAWKHWGCVTPKQISNLQESIEGDPKGLDGYEELPEDLQKKVDRALDQGHIDDEDWGWDVEMNREGKNGYLTLESKRRLKAEAQALKEEAAEEGSASPSKTNCKKRDHVNSDMEDAAEDDPPAKKIKARTKKEPKIKNEQIGGKSDDEDLTEKKTKSRIKKESKIKNENIGGKPDDEDLTEKKTKSRIKKEPKIKNEQIDGESDDEGLTEKKTKSRIKKDSKVKNKNTEPAFEDEGPSNKKTKAAFKKARKASGGEAASDFEQGTQALKKGRKGAKKAVAGVEFAPNIKDESSDHDVVPLTKGKKPRAPRKAAAAKKIKYEDTESDGSDLTSELGTPLDNVKPEHMSEVEPEASEDAPEVQKGRKQAPKNTVNGKAKKVEKGSEPKAIAPAPRSNRRATRLHPA